MALGLKMLNVAVICDSTWSGAVPVAASSSAGISTGTPGAVPVAASNSSLSGTDRLGVVSD